MCGIREPMDFTTPRVVGDRIRDVDGGGEPGEPGPDDEGFDGFGAHAETERSAVVTA